MKEAPRYKQRRYGAEFLLMQNHRDDGGTESFYMSFPSDGSVSCKESAQLQRRGEGARSEISRAVKIIVDHVLWDLAEEHGYTSANHR
jgi:hypothetical protein